MAHIDIEVPHRDFPSCYYDYEDGKSRQEAVSGIAKAPLQYLLGTCLQAKDICLQRHPEQCDHFASHYSYVTKNSTGPSNYNNLSMYARHPFATCPKTDHVSGTHPLTLQVGQASAGKRRPCSGQTMPKTQKPSNLNPSFLIFVLGVLYMYSQQRHSRTAEEGELTPQKAEAQSPKSLQQIQAFV